MIESKVPMIQVGMRMTSEMLEDLKRTASLRKMGGYQPLVREYIAEGLRRDAERLQWSALSKVVEALRERGVPDDVIEAAVQAAVTTLPSTTV